jgi:hypothetical protein
MIDYQKFHEIESVYFRPASSRAWRDLYRCLVSAGLTFDGDVFFRSRTGKIPPWQHRMTAEVHIYLDRAEVYGRGSTWDVLRIDYMFAYLPADCAENFIGIIELIGECLGLSPELNGAITNSDGLRASFDDFFDDLARELAEEPGTEALASFLACTYPRKPRT